MTEQKIEKKVIEKFGKIFLQNIQIIGSWDTPVLISKGEELKSTDGILFIKVNPRLYRTPTVPDAEITVELTLSVRCENDVKGLKYLSLCEQLVRPLQRWQQTYEDYAEDFAIDNEFCPTGFTLNGGTTSVSQDTTIWEYSMSFTIYGLLTN